MKEAITYLFVIEKLKGDGELRYFIDGWNGGKETVDLFWDENNRQERVPKAVMNKIFKNYEVKTRAYAIEGSSETGWYEVKGLTPQAPLSLRGDKDKLEELRELAKENGWGC